MHSITDSRNSAMQFSTIAPTSYTEPKTTYTTPIASSIDVTKKIFDFIIK